jgi:small-conductance mechanosensitive channel
MIKEILSYQIFSDESFTLTLGGVILATLVIFFNVFLLGFIVKMVMKRVGNKHEVDGRQLSIIQLLKYLMWIITIIICLQIFGVDITFLIASSAALLVGFGIGMQIIFKDYVSGIILLLEGIIRVNDIVEVGDLIVQVQEISLRTSKVLTRDDKIVIIPNHKFVEENVINWTHDAKPTRFIIDIGVDYSSDVKVVEKCLLEALLHQEDIIHQQDNHKPFVRFIHFGSSSLDFQLIFWSNKLFRIESVKSQIRFNIVALFKENGIVIPFTQVVVHQSKD